MDRITLRLEAARIAAQLTGVSTKNFIPVARRVERYIEGERNTHPEKEQATYHKPSERNDTQRNGPLDSFPRPQPLTKCDEWKNPFRWMPQYPDPVPADTLSRQMLQATGSCLADGRRTPARDAPTTIADGVQYLAPGGIPSSEAESIFLQADGEKVE